MASAMDVNSGGLAGPLHFVGLEVDVGHEQSATEITTECVGTHHEKSHCNSLLSRKNPSDDARDFASLHRVPKRRVRSEELFWKRSWVLRIMFFATPSFTHSLKELHS